ncbi:ABC1 family-domain-containing protein [Fimicolochytrium jonesii]|uniref:ABC1 family-domain-containing protein n=1 Tax=Fimicolochytrium jonesii TaxID=1396493 RepID=UPI0022FE06CB|nr:ABC1 family-domain-containing protein [Fimicolochytrium jonesii]KAI8821295.1 ABC1 family-domain-containing protein [Fimicolochytrium jonesii]
MFRPSFLPHQPSRLRRLGLLTTSALLGVAALDTYAYDRTLQRNIRTLVAGAIVTADYKWNFVPGNAENIEKLHERTAERILDVCKTNGGLYIKFGQQIAAVPVLPPAYLRFRTLFDDAPAVPYSAVRKIIHADFGKEPEEIFASFDEEPIAAASIAQVHRATLRDGTPVAVKVQKPEIRRQIGFDLMTYKFLCRALEFFFDLPLTWQANYIASHLQLETDFINEGRNAELAAHNLASAPDNLNERVHIPKVYWDESSKRVLTTEWIEGLRFTSSAEEMMRRGWSPKGVMRTVVEVSADQIFRSGFVHADPHPGNIIIRPHPSHPASAQIVLLDHGLYVHCTPTFTHDYALFWKSIFTGDITTLTSIASQWGIKDVRMFASATIQRPWTPGKAVHVDRSVNLGDLFERQVRMKETIRGFLDDAELLPKEVILIGRNLNIIRANNKYLGSPVNRINIMAHSAVKSLGPDWSIWSSPTSPPASPTTLLTPLAARLNYYTFRLTLLLSTLAFHLSRAVQKLRYVLTGVAGGGFEDVLDGGVREGLERLGIRVDEAVFSG